MTTELPEFDQTPKVGLTHEPMTGCRLNALGHWVPEDRIKTIDLLRDELVRKLVAEAEALSQLIAKAKADFHSQIAAFVELSAAEYRVHRGGKKGNVTLVSYDGQYKVERAIAELILFDERLQAAKALIDECLNDWTTDARTELRAIVQDAFRVDQQQQLRVQQILGLLRFEISDERWIRAMAAIKDSIQVIGSKSYVRFYRRVGASSWRRISLNAANAGEED